MWNETVGEGTVLFNVVFAPAIIKSFYSKDYLEDIVCDDGASRQLQSNEVEQKRGQCLIARNERMSSVQLADRSLK